MAYQVSVILVKIVSAFSVPGCNVEEILSLASVILIL